MSNPKSERVLKVVGAERYKRLQTLERSQSWRALDRVVDEILAEDNLLPRLLRLRITSVESAQSILDFLLIIRNENVAKLVLESPEFLPFCSQFTKFGEPDEPSDASTKTRMFNYWIDFLCEYCHIHPELPPPVLEKVVEGVVTFYKSLKDRTKVWNIALTSLALKFNFRDKL